MTKLTITRTSTSLSRLAALESRLIAFGAVIQGWDDKSIRIDVPVETEMKVAIMLSDKDFIVKAENA